VVFLVAIIFLSASASHARHGHRDYGVIMRRRVRAAPRFSWSRTGSPFRGLIWELGEADAQCAGNIRDSVMQKRSGRFKDLRAVTRRRQRWISDQRASSKHWSQ